MKPVMNPTVYEMWDKPQPLRAPHTRLYSLEPQGVGTIQVECLTSYLTRLAVAHSVQVSRLMMKEVGSYFRKMKARGRFSGEKTFTLNSVTDLTRELIWILQRLTGQLDLAYLTVLPWGQIVGSADVLRHWKAWCPVCLETQRQADQVVVTHQ